MVADKLCELVDIARSGKALTSLPPAIPSITIDGAGSRGELVGFLWGSGPRLGYEEGRVGVLDAAVSVTLR
jgi:hypothetical protein